MQLQGILEYVRIKWLYIGIVFFGIFCAYQFVFAATINTYSDTLSSSAPSQYSNHTIQFKTSVAIPPNGFIRFTPSPGNFDIPASPDFDVDNVALYVKTTGNYVLRSSTSTPSGIDDGVSFTTGTSGNIEVTLNSTDEIPAGAQIKLLVGTHTPNATTTDVGIMNPIATGTHSYLIEAGIGGSTSHVTGQVAIVDQVHIDDVDTTETDPPVRFNGAPSGTLSGTTLAVQVSLETDEFANCRYSYASGTPYFSMTEQFSSNFITVHSKIFSVATNTQYTFFVRCIDDENNVNIDDYVISFFVPEFPEGDPGDTTGNEGTGSGGGSGTGSSGSGSGTSGGSGSGGGSSSGSGGGGGGGGGSGNSSEGSGGSGGFEGSNKPYQSGDGRVIITGYAFPRSTITILVDGQIADTVTSGSDGSFASTIDAIARGAYTFGVYGTDKNGVRSTTYSTTFSITGSRGSTLSNVNVMPSIKVSPNPVDPNSILSVTGYTIPNAIVTIENQSDKSSATLKSFTANSDGNGLWSLSVSTDGFSKGTYKIRAKAKQDAGVFTNFSGYTFYGVGELAQGPRSPDLNRDGKVNLIDFSILLFWWNSSGGNSNPPADINGDGKVSLTDFSIMIFNWTG